MTDKKFTQEEVIKGLEICTNGKLGNEDCINCPYESGTRLCSDYLMLDALDLINRQKAEISKKDTEIDILIRKKEALRDENSELKAEVESLKDRNNKCIYLSDNETTEFCVDSICPKFKTEEMIKSEAIKEFWEKAKRTIQFRTQPYVYITDGDNLVKEMTEVQK